MSRRSLGSALAAIGIVLVAISALADQIGIGDEEAFGWQQIAGVVVGAAVAVAGFIVARFAKQSGDDVQG